MPPALAAIPNITHLSLNRLSRAHVEAIVARLGGDRLQAQTQASIVAQSDGVPLFVEELTKAVLEAGEAAIPASLHGSLLARLDRIGEVKEVAQIAACIGREFDLALLRSVAGQAAAVDAALDRLVAADLVLRRSDRAGPRFVFKHALVQEVAYESLLRGKRRTIHARILQALEAGSPDMAPEILAHHAQGAALADSAIGYWQSAGNLALAKSAFMEAAGFFGNAIRVIHDHGDGVDRRALELELQLRLGQALIGPLGYDTDATRRAFERALELADTVACSALYRAQAHYGVWASHVVHGEFDKILPLALKAVSNVATDATPEALLYAQRLVGASHLYRGEFTQARHHLEQARAITDASRWGAQPAEFGVDQGVSAVSQVAWVLSMQGYAEQSRQALSRAQSLGAALHQVAPRVSMHLMWAVVSASAGDVGAVRSNAQSLAELAARHRLRRYLLYGEAFLGWAAVAGNPSPDEAAVTNLQRSVNGLIARGTFLWIPFLLARLATALARRGQPDEARWNIERALAECEQNAQCWCEAEVWRMRGEVLLHDTAPDRAEAARCLERALAVARGQGAKLWELRAAVSLARLLAEQGRKAEALELLAPTYEWFTEGFDTPDLVEARTLLAGLGQGLHSQPGR